MQGQGDSSTSFPCAFRLSPSQAHSFGGCTSSLGGGGGGADRTSSHTNHVINRNKDPCRGAFPCATMFPMHLPTFSCPTASRQAFRCRPATNKHAARRTEDTSESDFSEAAMADTVPFRDPPPLDPLTRKRKPYMQSPAPPLKLSRG